MYLIRNLCPCQGVDMGRHGFTIELGPEWLELVEKSGMTSEHVARLIETKGRMWLDACGFIAIYDPDNCGHLADKKKPPGPNARPMYEPRTSLRFQWGRWGLEHLTVPGDACGLDLDSRMFGAYLGGAALTPHNIDSWKQKQLLLIVFCEVAEDIVLFAKSGGLKAKGGAA